MDWQEIADNWVLIPRHPLGIVHFLGGAFVAAAPQLTYRWLLEQLGREGYAIIATPFINTLEHQAIASEVLKQFNRTLEQLRKSSIIRKRYLPIYGIGHSMGCKLHLLIGSLFSIQRAGNILISYNNYPASRSIPLVDRINATSTFNIEFTPTPRETNKIVAQHYNIRRNLLIRFIEDDIDQTQGLIGILEKRFPGLIASQQLPGNHLTPLGQEIGWQPGKEFTPLDAIGQWVKQEVIYRNSNQLKREIIRWLNPTLPV